jgi:putative addiction module component (TIGR02574 family)
MSPDSDAILDAALRLPEDARLSLVTRLLESLPPEDMALALDDPRLADELDRRFADSEGTVPWTELKSEG